MFSILYLYGWLENLSTSNKDQNGVIFQSLCEKRAKKCVTDASMERELESYWGWAQSYYQSAC